MIKLTQQKQAGIGGKQYVLLLLSVLFELGKNERLGVENFVLVSPSSFQKQADGFTPPFPTASFNIWKSALGKIVLLLPFYFSGFCLFHEQKDLFSSESLVWLQTYLRIKYFNTWNLIWNMRCHRASMICFFMRKQRAVSHLLQTVLKGNLF